MTWIVMVYNGLPRSITKCFVSNVESYASMTRTCLTTIWHIYCVCFNNGLPRSEETVSSWKELTSISWKRDVFLPSCTLLVLVPTTGCTDLSVLTTGCSVRSRLGFGIGWFDWKLLDCCTTCPSGRWARVSRRSLVEAEVTCILFRVCLLQFPS